MQKLDSNLVRLLDAIMAYILQIVMLIMVLLVTTGVMQ